MLLKLIVKHNQKIQPDLYIFCFCNPISLESTELLPDFSSEFSDI